MLLFIAPTEDELFTWAKEFTKLKTIVMTNIIFALCIFPPVGRFH
jgi:hypothetical protein